MTGPLKSDQLSEQRLIGYIFAYWYQIGTMIEKAADTDEYLVRNTCLCVPYHDMMFSNAQSCCYNLKGQYTSSIISNFKSTLYCKSCISAWRFYPISAIGILAKCRISTPQAFLLFLMCSQCNGYTVTNWFLGYTFELMFSMVTRLIADVLLMLSCQDIDLLNNQHG